MFFKTVRPTARNQPTLLVWKFIDIFNQFDCPVQIPQRVIDKLKSTNTDTNPNIPNMTLIHSKPLLINEEHGFPVLKEYEAIEN